MSQISGRKARANGGRFETIIEQVCEIYRRKGTAYVTKTPEPMRPIKPLKGGQFVACFTSKAQPDYKGTIRGGRAVCFEAKHTDSTRIEAARVTMEQTAALDMHHKLGAACFVLVSFGFQRFYRVPWSVWRDMPGCFGKRSATETDLQPFKVDIEHFLDGLGVME